MIILSLDIDGVLNRHSRHSNGYCGIDEGCVRMLNWVLEEVPEAKILIHSEWRYMMIGGRMDLKGFEYLLLTHGVNCENRLIGFTDADSVRRRDSTTFDADVAERTAQICWWTGQHGGEDCTLVAVDDLPLNVKGFVRTDGMLGLSRQNAEQIIRLLRGEDPPK